jgi:hypothetical protein
MTDTATVEPGANVESTTPRGMPASEPVSVPDSSGPDGDGGESYNPQQDTAAAFQALREAKAAKAAETPAVPETKAEVAAEAAAATVPETPAAPAPDADPTDAKLNRVFNRIAALERERDEARDYARRFAEGAKRAEELEAKFKKLKADPREWMQESGWTQDTLADFILKGDEAVSPKLTTVEQRQSALEAEVQQLRAEREQAIQTKRIDDFVASIPGALGEHKSKFPTLTAYFDSDAEMAQQVFSVMRSAYQNQKTELTVLEAAEGLENVLVNQAKRFARRASSETPTTSPTASATKPAPTLTNKSTASPSPASAESDGVSLNYKAALETLRARTTKN